jgi:hypothetical protein
VKVHHPSERNESMETARNTDENGDRVYGERTAKDWAERLSELMSDDEFRAFVEFHDGCDDVDFFEELAAIDAERNPIEYDGDPEVESLAKSNEEEVSSIEGLSPEEAMILNKIREKDCGYWGTNDEDKAMKRLVGLGYAYRTGDAYRLTLKGTSVVLAALEAKLNGRR